MRKKSTAPGVQSCPSSASLGSLVRSLYARVHTRHVRPSPHSVYAPAWMCMPRQAIASHKEWWPGPTSGRKAVFPGQEAQHAGLWKAALLRRGYIVTEGV